MVVSPNNAPKKWWFPSSESPWTPGVPIFRGELLVSGTVYSKASICGDHQETIKMCLPKALHLSFGDKVLSRKIRRTFRGYWHPPGEVRCPFFQENNSVFFNLLEEKHQVHLGSSQILSQPLYHNFLCATLQNSDTIIRVKQQDQPVSTCILAGFFSNALDRKSRHTTVLKKFGERLITLW